MKAFMMFFIQFASFMGVCAQELQIEYMPFVRLYKTWYTYRYAEDVRQTMPYYFFGSGVERENGHEYFPLYCRYYRNNQQIVGLMREEDRKVYMYDSVANTENVIYDFSLSTGDVFTYNYGLDSPTRCKVLSSGEYKDGPMLYKFTYDEMTDEYTEYSRYLYYWTIGTENAPDVYDEATTWIEAAGGIHGPLADASPNPATIDTDSYLAYIETSIDQLRYIPFQFHDSITTSRGFNFEVLRADEQPDALNDDLTFELHADTLRIKGCLVLSCSEIYAFAHEEPTGSPDTTMIVLLMKEAGLAEDCTDLYMTDFSLPGFDPDKNYVVSFHNRKTYEVVNTNHQPTNIASPTTANRRKLARVYNLQGQRMAQPQTGLNIVGGRKVLMK